MSTTHRDGRPRRQILETDRLLGVDFAPRVVDVTDVVVAPAAPAVDAGPPDADPVTEPVGTLDQGALLAALHVRHDAECPHCTQATFHTRTVFGEGNPDADLMFVGEAPGAQEDLTGRPFVGRAGQKLDEMIRSMGLSREDVFIANVLKSRPPDNRTPLRDEVDACAPYLVEQIGIIRPRVIMTLGGPATKLLLDTTVGITRLRGQWSTFERGGLAVPVMPTFHPAYLLRNYTRDTRAKMWSDLKAVMERLGF